MPLRSPALAAHSKDSFALKELECDRAKKQLDSRVESLERDDKRDDGIAERWLTSQGRDLHPARRAPAKKKPESAWRGQACDMVAVHSSTLLWPGVLVSCTR